jgi:hypothetical protein
VAALLLYLVGPALSRQETVWPVAIAARRFHAILPVAFGVRFNASRYGLAGKKIKYNHTLLSLSSSMAAYGRSPSKSKQDTKES